MQRLSQVLTILNEYLRQQTFPAAPQQLYQPAEYIMELPGKRIRPALALLGGQVFTDDLTPFLPIGYAVELFHNFSLVHDDIMDDAPIRRGAPSVHVKYDTNTAILSGDVMLIYVYQHLCQHVAAAALPQVLATFNEVAIGVCEGQMMDMNFEQQSDVSLAEYMKMIELKTSVLLGGALKMGAQVAGASANDANHLFDFGCKTGVAFQIIDDLLDTFGETAKVGKQAGGDIIQNKKTYLYIKALETANEEQKAALLNWYAQSPTDPTEKVSAVRRIFKELDIPKTAEDAIQKLHQSALLDLEMIGTVAAERKQPLIELAEALLDREN